MLPKVPSLQVKWYSYLLLTYASLPFLTGCSHEPMMHKCYHINHELYCRELTREEELHICVELRKETLQGQTDVEMPAYCVKFYLE